MVEIDFDIVKVQLHDIDPKDFKSCAHLDHAPDIPEELIEKYSYMRLFNKLPELIFFNKDNQIKWEQ